MTVDAHGRSHRPSGLPQGYAGTYDGSTGASGGMDVTPPSSYYDGRMGEAERADWPAPIRNSIRPKPSHAGQLRRLLGDDPVEGSVSSVAGSYPGRTRACTPTSCVIRAAARTRWRARP